MTTEEATLLTDPIMARMGTIQKHMDLLLGGFSNMLERIQTLEGQIESLEGSHPFDTKLGLWKHRMCDSLQRACINVNDSMEMSWASARQIFGHLATPEHAFAIYSRIAEAQIDIDKGRDPSTLDDDQNPGPVDDDDSDDDYPDDDEPDEIEEEDGDDQPDAE